MREEKQLQNSTCKIQERVHVEELGVNGEVILTGFIGLGEVSGWRAEYVIETWVLLKAKGFMTSWITSSISGSTELVLKHNLASL